MSTIIRKENQVFFEFRGKLITKTQRGYRTITGKKFNGNLLARFIRNEKSIECRAEVAHLKSICNRHCGTEYSFTI